MKDRRTTRRFAAGLLSLMLMLTLVPMAELPTQAAPLTQGPSELFFSEYIEGSSNNKALEIYNGTGAAIDLAAGGYDIQMYFNGNSSAGLTINLTGTVADGDVYVIAHSSADAAILAQADQTNGAGWFNGNDAVVLRKNLAIIDAIGQIGFDPGTEWGSSLTSTADNTLRRKAIVRSGDHTGSDAFDPSVEWDGFATNTFDGLGSHTVLPGDAAPTVSSTTPADLAVDVALDANIDLTFSEPVNTSGSWFAISCGVSGSHTAVASGGPSTFTLDPDVDFASGETCTVNVFAANVSDQDSDDPPDSMLTDYSFSFTTTAPLCSTAFTPIYAIQGSGLTAAITGPVTTQGVVVGDFEGPSPALRGFYIQDITGDGDPITSDGIFIFNVNNDNVSLGQVVRVTGSAGEFQGQTQISSVTLIVDCDTTATVTPVNVTFPFPSANYPEQYEGMLVTFPELYISEFFNFDRFGEIVLTTDRQFQPTASFEPGSTDAANLALANALSRITLDDGRTSQNPDPAIHPNGDVFDLTNLFRGGDTVQNVTGIMDYRFGLYRIQPTQGADYIAANPRPAQPDDVGGNLKVTSFNVLNYFTTIDTGVFICGPAGDQECRGADTGEEFTRQRHKIIAALTAINADVVGLIEIENHPGDVPTADLVSGLNDVLGAGTYAYVATGAIGTDAIRVALIYKPATVTPFGAYAVLDSTVDPRFLDDFNRPVLAQTFQDNTNGGIFSVAVNHLKSKGSDCNAVGDPDTGDGSGNCNLTRKAAAEALVDWLATDPTGSGDADFLIMGDLNSYDKEEPIDAILAGADDILGTGDDFNDLLFSFVGEDAYSYLFDGQLGYLDHALANQDLLDEVTGVTVWHINADEPDLIDYDMTFKQAAQDAIYAPDAYRSSDHDPVIVGLQPATPMQLKNQARSDLAALLPSGDRKTDRRIEQAIERIERSLDAHLWESDLTLHPVHGKKVFDWERQAVRELMIAAKDNPQVAAAAQAAIDLLLEADRQLAQMALIAAIAGDGDAQKIAQAQKQMVKAADAVTRGRYDKAVEHYGNAWQYAVRALAHP